MSTTTAPRSPFRDRAFLSTLLTLVLPIIAQRLLLNSVNLLDSLMIGRLGDAEVAAVGVANQVYFVYILFLEGIAGGCSIFLSQYWGADNRQNILRVMGLGAVAVTAVGALFTILALFLPLPLLRLFTREAEVLALGRDYLVIIAASYLVSGFSMLLASSLRSIGNARPPLVASLFAILINITFNSLLIFGLLGFPRLGVKGAALATVLARFVEFALLTFFALRRGTPLRGRLYQYFDFGLPFAFRIFRESLPVLLNDTLWGIGFTGYSVAYGLLNSTVALAAVQISKTVEQIFMVFAFSISSAALVMVGNLAGAGEIEKAKDYGRKLILVTFWVGTVTGGALLLTSPLLLGLYQVSPAVSQTASTLLVILALSTPLKVCNATFIVGLFRGGGDAAYAARCELSLLWFVGLPLVFFGAAVLKLPIEWLLVLQLSEDLIKILLSLRHMRQGAWVRQIV
ncbi:MAG: MATE family efflux transporter [Clostridia bacterium]|nr:MATE family efflux transporter [Clostridia bacterium]